MQLFDRFAGRVSRSFGCIADLFTDFDTPLGLRFDGSLGTAKVGVSLHHVEGADIPNIAGNDQTGQVPLRGAIERPEMEASAAPPSAFMVLRI